ncbi:uncharacterized protein LOC116304358 [Actinia tenebrosa]|uniref:Uncharacterized protein LOC116304358 n=1 Tax=Actinia tenebrosa TaxID=6105 RepID=A0A6P8IUW7_ACTTE|nr:uncharacterized protein LOC116304358 [Actinia tenebrosa]
MMFNKPICSLFLLAWMFVVSHSTPLRDPIPEGDLDRDLYREIDRQIREPIGTSDLDDSKYELQRRCATFNCGILRKLRLGLGSKNRYRYRYGSHRNIYGSRTRQLQQRNINSHNQAKRDD